jgi:FtsH-binding integral membrane protein
MRRSSLYNNFFGTNKILGLNGGSNSLAKLLYEKKEFLILVFANLITQLGITYYIMTKTNNTNINTLFLLLAQIIIIFILILVPMPEFVKFFIFCLFSYIFGLILSVIKKKYNTNMINIAIQGALTVFALFLAGGVALVIGGINLGYKFGSMLFWSLLALIVLRLVLVMGEGLTQVNKILSFVGIILFAIYVLYDTNIILQRNYSGDFITASMDYYLDILNLFTNFLGSNDN